MAAPLVLRGDLEGHFEVLQQPVLEVDLLQVANGLVVSGEVRAVVAFVLKSAVLCRWGLG